jgi:hypothetical protein
MIKPPERPGLADPPAGPAEPRPDRPTAKSAVLPQPLLTAEEQAQLRAASQDALHAFRRRIAERKP